ncbi:hypothetical protein BDA96_04G166900 [Sorghum bicolor]|uniref:Uncharacterized protein n=1 Tax=Sorghum bicolor TaxID=4558 RepID=A0A921UKH9_SORBI|nr:hypothetical protein BDA96_04G166900 [Sorghum bicolor]KAG0533141.1 hypothetical protein BDA96_04G166900 [Sorghum bicolor]
MSLMCEEHPGGDAILNDAGVDSTQDIQRWAAGAWAGPLRAEVWKMAAAGLAQIPSPPSCASFPILAILVSSASAASSGDVDEAA